MQGSGWCVALWLMSCAAALSAQRTWIVDPESRAGFDFADLPPAIAASAAGDTIHVRGSNTRYISFNASLSKGITITGEGEVHRISYGWLSVYNLPPGQRLVVRDLSPESAMSMSFPPPRMEYGISIGNCEGSVHLQNLRCTPSQVGWPFPFSTFRVAIRYSRHVTLRGCKTVGGAGGGLDVIGGTVLAQDCEFGGNTAEWIIGGNSFSLSAYPAASITQSEVVAVDSQFFGGGGWVGYLCSFGQQNQGGILMASSRVVLVGTSTVRGGNTPNWPPCTGLRPVPCIVGDGTVIADPAAVLDPPPTVSVTRRAEPVTRSSLVSFGGTLRLDVAAAASALAATLVSLPGAVQPSAYGTLWLDPATTALVDLATLDAAGQRSIHLHGFTVPDDVPLLFQTATLVGGTLSLTVPAVTVVGQ